MFENNKSKNSPKYPVIKYTRLLNIQVWNVYELEG